MDHLSVTLEFFFQISVLKMGDLSGHQAPVFSVNRDSLRCLGPSPNPFEPVLLRCANLRDLRSRTPLRPRQRLWFPPKYHVDCKGNTPLAHLLP